MPIEQNGGSGLREEKSVQRDQSVSEMAQEILMHQAKDLPKGAGTP